ncbi:MAG: hypothetical protein LBQ79_01180 [Deltaproteobacteria bacterium]|jgi:hypothetical protein|nr:hypothetical protein [Deltaproteobacteria bacterium]
MTTIASLENDPKRGAGWALLRVEIPPADSRVLAAAGEVPMSFSVKDAQTGEWLQRPRTRRLWSLKEHFFQAERRPSGPGELAVSIPPAVTERLVENLFFFTVKGAGLFYQDLMVQAGHILTASTPIILTPGPGRYDDDEVEDEDGTEERLNASAEPPSPPFSGPSHEVRLEGGPPPEIGDGYELPTPSECLEAGRVDGGAGAGAGPEDAAPSGGEDPRPVPPATETESYGVPEALLRAGAGMSSGVSGEEESPEAADAGTGPFFPPEDLPKERPGFSLDPPRTDGGDGGLPVPVSGEDGGQDRAGRSGGPARRLWLVPALIALAAAVLYFALWRDVSLPPDSPPPPPEAEVWIPEPPPAVPAVPLEGCWAADGLSGAAPGARRRPVLVQYCFSSPFEAVLTVFDLDDGGGAEDACSSQASVSASGEGTLIAGDPGGPVCARAPDTSYYAMSLSCRPRPGGDVTCLIETGGGERPLEALFTRRS